MYADRSHRPEAARPEPVQRTRAGLSREERPPRPFHDHLDEALSTARASRRSLFGRRAARRFSLRRLTRGRFPEQDLVETRGPAPRSAAVVQGCRTREQECRITHGCAGSGSGAQGERWCTPRERPPPRADGGWHPLRAQWLAGPRAGTAGRGRPESDRGSRQRALASIPTWVTVRDDAGRPAAARLRAANRRSSSRSWTVSARSCLAKGGAKEVTVGDDVERLAEIVGSAGSGAIDGRSPRRISPTPRGHAGPVPPGAGDFPRSTADGTGQNSNGCANGSRPATPHVPPPPL